jgi:hypothetical protein
MPLETQIIRDGSPLQLSWGGFHVAAMVIAAAIDSGQGPFADNSLTGIYGPDMTLTPDRILGISPRNVWEMESYPAIGSTPLSSDGYELRADYRFGDVTDGEILELKKGDRLIAYRSWT